TEQPTNLAVGAVRDGGAAFDVRQWDDRIAAHEPGATTPLDGHAIRLGRLLVGESDLALERSLDRSDADLHHRPELIVAEGFEFLAPGNRLTKALGIEKCLPNFLPGRGNIVSAFDLHRLDLLCRAREMKGALVYQGTLCVALALQSQGTANGAIKQEGSQMKKLLSAVFALVLG